MFLKPHPVAFALKKHVEDELVRLEKNGVITKVENCEWGTPLAPVMRADGKFRLCEDYNTTANKILVHVNYPFPRVEEVYAAMQGGELFSRLDLRDAYNQLELGDDTKRLLAWSTHKGIFVPNRLPYGTKPACAIFQKHMEKVLLGIPGVKVLIDDITVTEKKLKNIYATYGKFLIAQNERI